jgi:exopolysaccharide biosynthesis polyprenyl glycosylphosphotransferase
VSIHETIAGSAIVARAPAGRDSLADAFVHSAPAAANLNDPHAVDHRLYVSLKRALDLAVAVPAFVVLAPVLLLIAVLVRLDSRGPVLFRQTRLGYAGRPFDIVKFRTMTVLENGPLVRQVTKNDARVTRVGRFLRSSSLDELPQLLNVISGEMSIVGPRPHARAHDEHYARLIDCYTGRQEMKPGITGWAQVNGHRGETPTVEAMRARVDCDLWYIRNANIGLDIEILLRTAIEVFRRRNAW